MKACDRFLRRTLGTALPSRSVDLRDEPARKGSARRKRAHDGLQGGGPGA